MNSALLCSPYKLTTEHKRKFCKGCHNRRSSERAIFHRQSLDGSTRDGETNSEGLSSILCYGNAYE